MSRISWGSPEPWIAHALTLSESNLPRANRIVSRNGRRECDVLPIEVRMLAELRERKALAVLANGEQVTLRMKGRRDHSLVAVFRGRRQLTDWAHLSDEKAIAWIARTKPVLRLVQ